MRFLCYLSVAGLAVAAGCAFDGSGSGGANSGATNFALSFDGNDDHVPLMRIVSNDFTLEAWVKTSRSRDGSQHWQGIPIHHSDLSGSARDFGSAVLSGKFAFGTGPDDSTVTSAADIDDDQWHHVAATRQRSSGTMCVYVDGDFGSCVGTNNDGLLAAQPLLVIGGNLVDDRYFRGLIDEVRIWNIVRTPQQIAQDRARVLVGTEDGLVGYYRFDDADTPLTAVDSTSAANDGEMSGGTAPVFVDEGAPLAP